jgi:hypothetical protein
MRTAARAPGARACCRGSEAPGPSPPGPPPAPATVIIIIIIIIIISSSRIFIIIIIIIIIRLQSVYIISELISPPSEQAVRIPYRQRAHPVHLHILMLPQLVLEDLPPKHTTPPAQPPTPMMLTDPSSATV